LYREDQWDSSTAQEDRHTSRDKERPGEERSKLTAKLSGG